MALADFDERFEKEVIDLITYRYPKVLKLSVFAHTPLWARATWALLKRVIPSEYSTTTFFERDAFGKSGRFINPAKVPIMLGGLLHYDHTEWMSAKAS